MWGNAILKIAQHKRTCGGSVGIGSPSCVPTRTLSSPFCIGALLTRLTDTVADGVGSFPALFFRALPSSAPSVPCGRGALNCGRKHEVSGERLSATSAFWLSRLEVLRSEWQTRKFGCSAPMTARWGRGHVHVYAQLS